MGWTYYHANYYKNNGEIKRKAECDAYFEEGLNRGHFKVERSSMVGRVYYATVRRLVKYDGKDADRNRIYTALPEDEQSIFGAVLLTNTDKKSFYNFGYKDMDETEGPCYYDCPKSILVLLSETDNEYALDWRKKCWEATKDNGTKKLGKMAVGTKIQFMKPDGEIVSLIKTKLNGYKNPKWVDFKARKYYLPSQIIQYPFQVC